MAPQAWAHVFAMGLITIEPGRFVLSNRTYRTELRLTPDHEAVYREWFAAWVARTCRHVPRCRFEF